MVVLWWIASLLILFFVGKSVYKESSLDQSEIDIIAQNCPESVDSSTDVAFVFISWVCVHSAPTSSFFGAYIGIIIDSKFLGGTQHNVNDTYLKSTLYRYLIILLFAVSSYYLIEWIWQSKSNYDFITTKFDNLDSLSV